MKYMKTCKKENRFLVSNVTPEDREIVELLGYEFDGKHYDIYGKETCLGVYEMIRKDIYDCLMLGHVLQGINRDLNVTIDVFYADGSIKETITAPAKEMWYKIPFEDMDLPCEIMCINAKEINLQVYTEEEPE